MSLEPQGGEAGDGVALVSVRNPLTPPNSTPYVVRAWNVAHRCSGPSMFHSKGANGMPRETSKYHFKRGNKILHTGITYDLERREQEHKRNIDSAGHIFQVVAQHGTLQRLGRTISGEGASQRARDLTRPVSVAMTARAGGGKLQAELDCDSGRVRPVARLPKGPDRAGLHVESVCRPAGCTNDRE